MIRALFFGPVADAVGGRCLELEYRPGLSLDELRAQLARDYPAAFALVSFVAVDGVQARDFSLPLADGSDVAFMAKFSGG